jgi:folate-dependent phosphoribosylglycinamide formyltransferase PurN
VPAERVVLLTCDGESGRMAANYLAARFPELRVIVETPISRSELLRRRLRRLGAVRVAGQLAFMLFQRLQHAVSRRRIAVIVRAAGLDDRWPDMSRVLPLSSVNSTECVMALAEFRPQVVLVVGTRLIDSEVLQQIGVPVINYHAGITPKYRGVHGGYWALAEDDAAHCGVTVHIVDAGIDTGGILHQAGIAPSSEDNFSTYPYLQLVAALPLLQRAGEEALAGTLKIRLVELPSHLWSHPTIWSYLATGLRRGVW